MMVEVSPVVCPVSASVARHQRVFLVAPQETPRTAHTSPAATMQVLTPPLQQQQQRIVYILKPEIKIEQAAPQLQQPSPPPPRRRRGHCLGWLLLSLFLATPRKRAAGMMIIHPQSGPLLPEPEPSPSTSLLSSCLGNQTHTRFG